MIELVVFCFAGLVVGALCGLVPGLHTNSVSAAIAGLAFSGNLGFVVLIVSMTVSQAFFDFVPNTLIGAPDADDFLHALPAHKMYLEGKAMEAIQLSCFGCLFGVVLAILFSPLLLALANDLQKYFPQLFAAVLCALVLFAVLSEKKWKKIVLAFLVVALASTIGVYCLRETVFEHSILALVSGFFGAPTLFWSVYRPFKAKKQQFFSKTIIPAKEFFFSGFLGSIAGAVVSIIPSIGPSQAAFGVRGVFGEVSRKGYLVLLGAISSSNALFAFFVLYFFGKPRSGSAIAVQQLYSLSWTDFWLIIGFGVFCAGIAFLLCTNLSKHFTVLVQKIDSAKLSLAVLVGLGAFVLVFCGLVGFAAFLSSFGLGLFVVAMRLHRMHLMAFLVAPTLLYYFPLVL